MKKNSETNIQRLECFCGCDSNIKTGNENTRKQNQS